MFLQCYHYSRRSTWGYQCQHYCQLFVVKKYTLFRKLLLSLEYSDKPCQFVTVKPLSLWSARNTTNSLCVPTVKSSDDSGQEIVWTSLLGLHVISIVHHLLFRSCATNRSKNSGIPACMKHTWCPWRTVKPSKNTGKPLHKNWRHTCIFWSVR